MRGSGREERRVKGVGSKSEREERIEERRRKMLSENGGGGETARDGGRMCQKQLGSRDKEVREGEGKIGMESKGRGIRE